MKTSQLSKRHDNASFPVRRLEFDFANTPRHMYKGNPLTSYFWLVLQAKFPDGEQFFIDSVRGLRDLVKDEKLQADISAFIGQEAMHGQAHRKANEQLMATHGINVKRTERRTKRLMRIFSRFHSKKQCLAATAGAEHLTASIARFLLNNPSYLDGFNDPTIRRLVMWHALEEREHRSVAYDVYQQAGGGYVTRVSMYVWFLAYLAPFVTLDVIRLLAEDRNSLKLGPTLSGLQDLFGSRGVLGGSLPALLEYFRPGFHPTDDDQTKLENVWRTELGLNAA